MAYKNSLQFICDNIRIGYKLYIKYFGNATLMSLPTRENTIILVSNDFNIKKEMMLKIIYEKKLIAYDNDLFISDNKQVLHFKEKINNYDDLKKAMFKHSKMPNEFFHFTHYRNAINILKSGYIKSRDTVGKDLLFDNFVQNETTKSVIATNYSNRTIKYVRFYLNPQNKTTYSLKKNIESKNGFGVLVAIDFSTIWKSNSHVFLTPQNAHYCFSNYFDWNGINDISIPANIPLINFNKFDFRMTFERYDPFIDNRYLMAEILFYEKIPISFISHIYFKNSDQKDDFLSNLPYDLKNRFYDKCIVNDRLLWGVDE